MGVPEYLKEWWSFSGLLSAKRYGALATPLIIGFGVLNVVGMAIAFAVTRSVGGYVILTAMIGVTLSGVPLYVRRARDIGWSPILTSLSAIAACVSYVAFVSILLPLSTGFWSALERTDIPLIVWGVLFATILGVWIWCWRSLSDRPSKGGALPQQQTAVDLPAAPEPVAPPQSGLGATFLGRLLITVTGMFGPITLGLAVVSFAPESWGNAFGWVFGALFFIGWFWASSYGLGTRNAPAAPSESQNAAKSPKP